MDVQIVHGPANSAAQIKLSQGQTCVSEAGAMIAMSGSLSITTTTHKKKSGSMMKALKRMLVGESIFLNHFSADKNPGEIWLSTTLSGDMACIDMNAGTNLVVQSGSFVACSEAIEMDIGWQGFQSLFSGESLLWIKMSGTGKTILSSFGAIYPIDVTDTYIVDTGHIVAFEDTLSFDIKKVSSSWLSTIFGGEGLVCRFKGKGRLWVQSHNPSEFGKNLTSYLKPIKQ